MSFKSQLNDFLSDCKKLIVLGVGNELKSDDGVGPFIIKQLKDQNIENENMLFIDAETVPENFTGKIRKENPTHLIIVDACLMNAQPADQDCRQEGFCRHWHFNPFNVLVVFCEIS